MRAKRSAMTDYPQLGSYQLLYEVGYGGMGSVFLADDTVSGSGKRVAVKTIHPHLARKAPFVAMFLDEARLARAMNHQNVARVFDLGEADGTYFYAMEYLHGEHLGALRSKVGRMSVAQVGRIARMTARGLHHAHELRGDDGRPLELVHRDISPQNIFVTYDGEVKVTDFGIARAEGRLAQTTDTGRLKGKCAYMSPEQVMSSPLDRRADIFALGVVMWELLAGERLFGPGSDAETLLKIADDDIPPLGERVDIAPEFEAIVMKALAHRREERFSTADELADAIDTYLESNDTGSSESLAQLMSEHFREERREKERTQAERFKRRGALRQRTDTLQDRRDAEADEPIVADAGGEKTDTLVDAGVAAEMAIQVVGETNGVKKPGIPTKLLWAAFVALIAAAGIAWSAFAAPGAAAVRIATTPAGAAIRLDGEDRRLNTPAVIRDLSHGRHRLVLSLHGFEPLEVTFDVDRPRIELGYRLIASSTEPPADIGTLPETYQLPIGVDAPPDPSRMLNEALDPE